MEVKKNVLFGARDYGRMKTAVSTACIFSAALCLALMLAGILGCGPLLPTPRSKAFTNNMSTAIFETDEAARKKKGVLESPIAESTDLALPSWPDIPPLSS